MMTIGKLIICFILALISVALIKGIMEAHFEAKQMAKRDECFKYRVRFLSTILNREVKPCDRGYNYCRICPYSSVFNQHLLDGFKRDIEIQKTM
jgi:hypothetical protein